MSFSIPYPRRIRRLKQRLLSHFHVSENTFMVVLAVIIGVLAGLGNYVFRKTIDLIHFLDGPVIHPHDNIFIIISGRRDC